MFTTLIIALALSTTTPTTPKPQEMPKETAFLFKDQQAVYNIPARKRS